MHGMVLATCAQANFVYLLAPHCYKLLQKEVSKMLYSRKVFRHNAPHALNKLNTVKGSNMYYVVTKALAARMQGSRIPPANVGGTVKGIFATGTKAASFLLSNKLQSTYTIVFL